MPRAGPRWGQGSQHPLPFTVLLFGFYPSWCTWMGSVFSLGLETVLFLDFNSPSVFPTSPSELHCDN